jgi:aminoglycoside phosphotransferase (APT) family kinase protein
MKMDLSDRAISIREGEELDTKRVEEYLQDSLPGLTGGLVVEQFPSGFSNLTYLIRVGDREMVLRRPPFGRKAKTAHDMGREFKILSALHGAYPYTPKPLLYSEDPSVMGCPFYVMERIPGIILRKQMPEGLDLTPEQGVLLCNRLVDVLCELHAVDYKAVGLEDFGKPVGYVRRQVEGWSERYRQARTPDAPAYEDFMKWLLERMPGESSSYSVIHNDYKFDNVVLSLQDPLKIVGVLDWEMATIGDPLMDLGCFLAYWVHPSDPPAVQLAAMMPVHMPGLLTKEQMVERYAQTSGRKLTIEDFEFYYCFGIFRVAVILQQIYYRFYHGQTKDKRFGTLIFGVHIIDQELTKHIQGL